ncbi:MAG: glycosyltransferase family 4 protein [Anaerolineales bacterium]|nr:glycosyltransferase family 4 protein [Anaerolineales bacterium]
MKEKSYKIGILHYSAPPVIGGVESVIHAHANLFLEAGYSTTVIAGRGDKNSLPHGTELILIPEMDTKHPQILEMSSELEQGVFPENFDAMTDSLTKSLTAHLSNMDMVIVHNVFTKHFNLPLTAALFRLLDRHAIHHCVAWCHDITWTSPHSRPKVHDGFPWDLLRTFRTEMTYVTISHDRQQDLTGLFGCPPETIRVIYNGVDQNDLLALSDFGRTLIDRLGLWDSDLNLLLPVRVTQAKNMELALKVVAALKKRKINVRLIVTGPPDPHDQKDIEYFQELLDLRKRLGVEEEMRFVYQSGDDPSKPLIVEMSVVSELFRVSDALFMPSHREGFGMPILEAGLVGIPIFCADTIPSAKEIAAQDAVMFPPDADPEIVADMILDKMKDDPVYHFRQKVRKNLSWHGIFQHDMISLIEKGGK